MTLGSPSDRGTTPGESGMAHAGLILTTVAWFALATGLLEAAFLLGKWKLFSQFTWTSVHIIWMAPVANLLLLLVPGVMVAGLALLRSRWVSLTAVAGALIFGAATCLLVVGFNGSLAFWSVLLLALGIAIRLALLIARRRERFGRFIRRTTPALAGMVLVLAVIVPGWMKLRERSALGSLPEAGKSPNVLLIILDTVRAASMGLYDSTLSTTPNLQQWARRATVFDLALAPAPWTLPSHGAMFTGRWPHELTAGWKTPMGRQFPTLAEVLRQRGYITAGFVANHYYTTRQSGLDRGFIHYDDLPVTLKEVMRSSLLGQATAGLVSRGRYRFQPERSTSRRDAGEISRSFLEWLPAQRGRPWFAFLNYFDAHKPYRLPDSVAARPSSPGEPVVVYERTIQYLDMELGGLLAELERNGDLSNTLVVITSDHGEQFGQHGLSGHGNSLYRTATQVPLILWHSEEVPRDRRVSRPVSLRDLPRTILDLVGSSTDGIPGATLAATWRDGAYPDTVLSELLEDLPDVQDQLMEAPMYSLMTREYHYIRQADGREELYDVRDKTEEVNIVDSTAAHPALTQLRRSLQARVPSAPR